MGVKEGASPSLPDGEDLSKVEVHVVDLGDEDGRHGLVEGGAVHVDGGPHWEDEARHPLVHAVVLLQTAEGNGQGASAGGREGERVKG